MLTRRDLLMALAGGTAALVCTAVLAGQGTVLNSTVYDWTAMTPQPTKVGEVRRVVQAPTATLDELEIHITSLDAGQTSHPPHQHPAEELLIIKEGTLESLVNGHYQQVGPGSVVFQASNQMHTIRNVGQTRATYHVIQWNSPGMLKKR